MEWNTRLDLEHRAGNLTRAERDALRALGRLMAMGDHMPSEARLASEAAVSVRSVSRAKARARELGLLAWERRHADDGLRRELPCAYRAETPARAVVRRERQRGRGQQSPRVIHSAAAQIAACGQITPAHQRLWEARRAARGATSSGLPMDAR